MPQVDGPENLFTKLPSTGLPSYERAYNEYHREQISEHEVEKSDGKPDTNSSGRTRRKAASHDAGCDSC